jgi:crossover junction endodeoxyribonuclease RuvC
MGIDPGATVTGYGVVESRGQQLRHIASGAVRLSRSSVSTRLNEIFDRIRAVIDETGPEQIAVEKVFFARNARSALILGQARGAALVACGQAGGVVHEYSALEIKQALVGRGRAEKSQVQHMVRVLLGLREAPQADAADALACAICHINHARSRDRYASAAGAAP